LPRRIAVFQPEFREDLRYWVETDRKIALRAFDLIEAILRDPFVGIGKPEPLKYLAAGVWSRRLTEEHRIVYLVRDDRIDFLQARYHY
jgi:toxin YoeB